MRSISIGEVNASRPPLPSTDIDGTFVGRALVPGVPPGTYAVAVPVWRSGVLTEWATAQVRINSGVYKPTPPVGNQRLTVTPSTTNSGNYVILSGAGFPAYVHVDDVRVGGVSAIPTPKPSTDANGNFVTSVLIPKLRIGSHFLTVTAHGWTGTASVYVR